MRIILFFLFVIVFNCSGQSHHQYVALFNSSLKAEGLFGKVKEFVHFRIDTNLDTCNLTYDTTSVNWKKYSNFGKCIYSYYNTYSNRMITTNEFKYNKDKLLINYKTNFTNYGDIRLPSPEDYCEEGTIKHTNNQIFVVGKLTLKNKINFNEKTDPSINQFHILDIESHKDLNFQVVYKINKHNDIIDMDYKGTRDTFKFNSNFTYNKYGKVLIENTVRKRNNSKKEIIIRKRNYNSANKLIEQIEYFDNIEMTKLLKSYDTHKGLTTVKEYNHQRLISEAIFDKNNDIISYKSYDKDRLIKEEKKYYYTKYDKYNNWTEKKIKTWYYNTKEANKVDIYTELETRKIIYYP